MLETCDPESRQHLEGCLDAAWAAINRGTVDEPRRLRYWDHWCRYTSERWRVSPFLDGCSATQRAGILAAFAVGGRKGHYGRGFRIAAQSVDRALRAVGQTFQLAGRPDPTKANGGRKRIIHLRRLLESFRREDPPPKPQLAIPVSVIDYLQGIACGPAESAVTDLATIAFFFLLRVGEDMMPRAGQLT